MQTEIVLPETKPGSPSVAVEILSPDDRVRDVRDKVVTDLRAGTDAVIIVDPKTETIRADSISGSTSWSIVDTLTHPSLPSFMLDVAAYSARAKK